MSDKERKILVVASSNMGGSGIVAFRLASKFAQDKIATYFLGFDKPHLDVDDNSFSNRLCILTPKIFNYPLFNFELKESSLVESIVDTVIKFEITEIHCHYSFVYGFAGITAKKLLKSVYDIEIKLILVCHGTDVIGYDSLQIGKDVFKHYNKYVINQADVVVCASQALKKLIISIYDIDRNIEVIPNFIDEKKFKVIPHIHRDPFSIVHVSNFRKIKRPQMIIDIFQHVYSELPEAKLVMVGEGPLLNETIEYSELLGLSNNVEFVGKVQSENKIAEILNSTSVFIHPSLFENASLTCLEALACGVPVVCSNVGGLPELIQDGYNGFLVDKNDTVTFAQKCIQILSDRLLWKQLSKNATNTIKKEGYELSIITQKFLDII